LRKRFGKLAELMDEAEDDVLATRAPQRRDQAAHRRRGDLPNGDAIVRLVGALLLAQNDGGPSHGAT